LGINKQHLGPLVGRLKLVGKKKHSFTTYLTFAKMSKVIIRFFVQFMKCLNQNL